ncbi:MAG: TrmH family RNA methyltransferase [Candidatus Paceibacterota bacterium]
MVAKSRDVRLLLDNIRSVHNVGSIFRTAETIGISRIYCLGTTPVPVDRFGRKRGDFAKVALGAEDIVPWEHTRVSTALIRRLKEDDFEIVALEQTASSVDYKRVRRHRKMLIVVGNEVDGVSKNLLEVSDVVAEIPMSGKKESLNVSVATGIFLFRLMDVDL